MEAAWRVRKKKAGEIQIQTVQKRAYKKAGKFKVMEPRTKQVRIEFDVV